ncbi:Peptidase family S41 [Croceitalea dokdonensis DOKDO 023]|uniref:Peptidase family S41 n=2 Tax=Croceitalea TaxID=574891 RepID=A0A0P7AVT8_9FLAO|nr:Peptidase family S41 [Croceitalea dokdonensis DOKDO 023]
MVLMGILIGNTVKAQDCRCKTDFDQLNLLLRKTPAYKDHKKAYEENHLKLQSIVGKVSLDYDCLVLLNRLALGLNDNHSNIFGLADKNAVKIQKTKMNLDSLEQALAAKPFTAIEGVYSLPKYVTLGLYKEQETYIGVILASQLPNWDAGDIMYTLLPYGKDLHLAIFGQGKSKRIVAVSERIKHGMFLKLGLRKNKEAQAFHLAPEPDSLFIKKELDNAISYIKTGSFSSFYPKLADAEAFYASLQDKLTKKHLIVDLRDNTGGGERNSNILLELLTTYAQNNKLYVLINHNTASNAEQFTLKLKQLPNTTILGDRTQGTLAYELKKNISNPLGCGKFVAIVTSKRHKEYLPFESKGIEPDMLLEYDRDWITQTMEFINAH